MMEILIPIPAVTVIGLICAILALAGIIYMLVRPYKEATTLKA
mgnify:FL=1